MTAPCPAQAQNQQRDRHRLETNRDHSALTIERDRRVCLTPYVLPH